MTPKEQANQLFIKHYQSIFEIGEELSEESIISLLSIEAAQITVNQIILSNPHGNPLNSDGKSTMEYWKEVEKELLKL